MNPIEHRSSGILLHPTSLPGHYGIGDLGPNADRWIDTLAAMKQTYWQILPLGPTGFGDSPYQSYSAFAGNINLLSPERLIEDGLLDPAFAAGQSFSDSIVEFEKVEVFKKAMVKSAWEWFRAGKAPQLKGEYEEFQHCEAAWLSDYTRFMGLRDGFSGRPLAQWPVELLKHDPVALSHSERSVSQIISLYTFGQFLFDRQWNRLHMYATEKGIRILGDAPIFVAGDSADVWAHPEEFLLDAEYQPKVVAGVPPDYFSEDGQHWGNPLYDWAKMQSTGFAWWNARLKRQLSQVDVVRLDHFRGFAAAWHIPADEKTAKNGVWVDGPRAALFDALKQSLGSLAIVAEDLGVITEDVEELRTRFGLPGMRVLQFMLGEPANPYWPHNYEPNTVAYTGTHDNDTTLGWYRTLNETDQKKLADYGGHEFREPHWDLLRMAWGSIAVLAIAPLQDILGIGGEGRMNVPGVAAGNWRWRFRADQFPAGVIERVAEWTERYRRVPGKEK